ncbi:uncharacterized protein LOC134436832 [Engraulis encrasicolus]|uniref:uncharacterized protein LOC134436832 n=1 Tax=Engraulis encrasicolus TaxID=184585 RepID=UPI002FD4FBD6
MEAVLTRLRDFSCREATFDTCEPTAAMALPVPLPRRRDMDTDSSANGSRLVTEEPRGGSGDRLPPMGTPPTHRLDIESALAWLRKELIEMRSQDQVLIRQLMDLHEGIQELKLDYAEAELDLEDEDEEEEEEDGEPAGWESDDSDAGTNSSSNSPSTTTSSSSELQLGSGELVSYSPSPPSATSSRLLLPGLSPSRHPPPSHCSYPYYSPLGYRPKHLLCSRRSSLP